jgi:plasmid stability protein
MATLYVENIPDDLYQALREQAKRNRTSIAAEVTSLLKENVVTARQRKARQLWVKKLEKLHASLRGRGIDIPAEHLLREDRER